MSFELFGWVGCLFWLFPFVLGEAGRLNPFYYVFVEGLCGCFVVLFDTFYLFLFLFCVCMS